MNSIEAWREFLGWCTVLNMAMLAFVGILVSLMRGTMVEIHGKMYGLAEDELSRQYFQYLAQYKIAIFVLNLIPYVALTLMT